MIPDPKVRRWFDRKAVAEAFTVGPPIAAGVVTGLVYLQDAARRGFGQFLLGGAAWLTVGSLLKVVQAHRQDRDQQVSDKHDGLQAALHVVHALVRATRQDGDLRITIHRVVRRGRSKKAEDLEQILPYLGGRGGAPGRPFSIRSGIIGRAAREQKLIAASRKNEDVQEFVNELVGVWGFTEEEARMRRTDRWSWCAIPILDRRYDTTAVVFMDSNRHGFFTKDVTHLIATACVGLTIYIRERY